jgi:hypothetical protein
MIGKGVDDDRRTAIHALPNSDRGENMPGSRVVTTAAELQEAIQAGEAAIEIEGELAGMPMITLAPGMALRGGTLRFGAKGIRLTRDNILEGVTVITEPDEVAILNDPSSADLGTLTLRDVQTTGQVLLVAADQVRAGHVQVENLTIVEADVRGRVDRPHGFGVEALQGGFTLWNRQADPDVRITAELLDISAGSADTPVRGSGVFVGGHGNWEGIGDGGTVQVSTLRTGEIHVNGGIPAGTPDLISGGVFVISGAVVDEVLNTGPVTTYGQNDMVLDNWGDVTAWTATAPVTSRGPSGIGFVNFGNITTLDVNAPVVTSGPGARGFNLYEGSLERASFSSIATTGDGSVGVQISKPLGRLKIEGDLTTSGDEGMSLVKGVQVQLKAVALSIKPGGEVNTINVGGTIATTGNNVVTVEIEGEVGQLSVAGGISASGAGSDAVHTRANGPDLSGIAIHADHGQAISTISA